jgi:hypothetical protein
MEDKEKKTSPKKLEQILRWQKSHPEKIAEYDRRHQLKWRYNLTPEEWEKIFEEQDGKCAICKEEASGRKRLFVDHETKKVRGLLCNRCNQVLGYLEEDTFILSNMIEYINKYNKK